MISETEQTAPGKNGKPLLEIKGMKKYFPVKGGVLLRTKAQLKAVDDISLTIHPGETLGLVGESGCGKSTLGKCVCRLHDVTDGTIRHSIGNILEEPLLIHGIKPGRERRKRVAKILDTVGLPSDSIHRFPFEFSGGQRQRIGIARAISLNPELVVCDEPVSALDVSVQSQILNLMMDLQQEFNLSYLFIAHDLAVVKHISDRIAIMYLGKIVELGPAEEIFKNPIHAYTKALISAIPLPEPNVVRERILLKGDVPSPIDPPPGCAFARRSWIPCSEEEMQQPGEFKEVKPGHWVEVHPGTVENYSQYKG